VDTNPHQGGAVAAAAVVAVTVMAMTVTKAVVPLVEARRIRVCGAPFHFEVTATSVGPRN
jgi:hypothetical protein